MVEREVRLPDRRQGQARLHDVGGDARRAGAAAGRDRRRDGGVEVRHVGTGQAVRVEVQAGVLERTGQPHVRVAALEQADAAAQLGRTIAVEGVVEAEARLPQLLVEGHAVVEAVDLLDARVVDRRVTEVGHVDADAEHQAEVVVDRPGVLHEQAQVLELVRGRDVGAAAAGARGAEVVAQRVAGLEVFQAVEGPHAVEVTAVEVEDVVVLVVEAELQGVVAHVPGARAEERGLLGVDDVDVAVALGAQVDGVLTGADVVDDDRRQVGVGRGDRGVVALRDLELGREVVAPVAEQLGDGALEGLVLVVPVARQRDAAATEADQLGHHFLGLAVAQGRAVVVVDVPVELDRVFLDVGLGDARRVQAARIEAEAVGGRDHALDVRVGDVTVAVRGAGQAGARALALELLVVGEEEQAVLDDRATQGEAVGLFLVEAVEVDATQLVAHPVTVADGVVGAAVELVGARLGHGVDHRAGATGDGGVVVGQVDLDFLDRVHGDRLALGRHVVGLEAERVGVADAVDADDVEARVLATGRDRAIGLADLRDARVEADVVLDVARRRRQGLEGVVVEVGAGAHLGGTEDLGATGHADRGHGGERGDVAGELGVDGVGGVQAEIDVVLGLGAGAGLGDGDLVRAAHAQAAGAVAATGVGGHATRGAGLDVGDGDFGVGDRLAIGAHHDAADARGRRALREDGCGGKRGDQAERKFRHTEGVVTGHG